MFTAACLVSLLTLAQPPAPPRPDTTAPPPRFELRFKPAPAERLRYRLNIDESSAGFGKELRPSKCEVDIALTVKEHTPERIATDMTYERIKVSAGEKDDAVAYDSAEKAANERQEVVASWIKPILAKKFTVVCDGRGEIQDIQGMAGDPMKAMAQSPLFSPAGQEQARRVGLASIGIGSALTGLTSGIVSEPVQALFNVGPDAPAKVAVGDSWGDKESEVRWTVEKIADSAAAIHITAREGRFQPEGQETTIDGHTEWDGKTGTLVRADSSSKVIKTPGPLMAGEYHNWKLTRLPAAAPTTPRDAPEKATEKK